ncbi:hypothetical protein [Lysinibacillus sp. BPa_S21]|nr:hypothetical protein [Lysinibacillus sp. BPa_S21]
MITEVIDELNRRMEESLDNEDTEAYNNLNAFYQWFVEKFIY